MNDERGSMSTTESRRYKPLKRVDEKPYALKSRLKSYAVDIVRLFRRLPSDREDIRVVSRQLLRCGTSVAANHREASRARSRAEFVSKIELCIQEADEALFWIEILGEGCGVAGLEPLHEETDEIISILVATARSTKRNNSL